MAFDIDIGFTSHPGRKEINEDFCSAKAPDILQQPWGTLCAIADGVSAGGHGRDAAQSAVMSLMRDYYETPENWNITEALESTIANHNAWLMGINQGRAPESGLTTLTALVLRSQGYTVAHVGDSRAYLLRNGEILQLTTDHVNELPDMQHQLRRAVGAESNLQVDYMQGPLQAGDVFVLVTDGVHGMIQPARLAVFAQEGDAQTISEQMVNAAVDLGGQDNASAVVVRILGVQTTDSLLAENEVAHLLALPHKLSAGDQIDGMLVMDLVAAPGAHLRYQVRDPMSQKLFLLKTLRPKLQDDATERELLAHEAWLTKRMQTSAAGSYLVHLHDAPPCGIAEHFYVLYDWHNGETLQQMLDARGKLEVQQAVSAASHTLMALALLHEQGVIHRDIKPANLHWGSDGVLRVLDLGVALSGSEPESARLQHAGTPSYINPEQYGYSVQGDRPEKSADPQSDLFALGVTLYQLLTGKLPYGEVLPYQTGRYAKDPLPPSRSNPEVPAWLDHLVLQAISRNEHQRFASAEEFLLALQTGASQPLDALSVTSAPQRDRQALWKMALAASVLLNLFLLLWFVVLPK
jgi:serine/threonine protein phosphatase PrpC/serine/threonine protein kinase